MLLGSNIIVMNIHDPIEAMRGSRMSEEILKISLKELTTVRLKRRDGVIVEMPLDRVSEYSKEQRIANQMSADVSDTMANLHAALDNAQSMPDGYEIEFVLPVDSNS